MCMCVIITHNRGSHFDRTSRPDNADGGAWFDWARQPRNIMKKSMADKALYAYDDFAVDNIRAVDAKAKAQEIAFSPLTFQAVRSLIELGILRVVEDAGEAGLTRCEIASKSDISEYGAGVLCEMALGMGVLRLAKSTTSTSGDDEHFVLGKVGWMLLEDDLTRANFDFVADVCYKGAEDLCEAVKTGRPAGLKHFGNWTTIYEGLSQLPSKTKRSWFKFDHFYSDVAFEECLDIVFGDEKTKPRTMVDIGGNTAKWAIAACRVDSDVHVTIVDLPGQTAVAEENARKAGFADRITTVSGNILQDASLPQSDAYWMSQFLDCFSLHQVTKILKLVRQAARENSKVFVLEPLWDMQRFAASSYSLMATSLYFTCMANGNSKMYRYNEIVKAVQQAGFALKEAHHNLGGSHSLLMFAKDKA